MISKKKILKATTVVITLRLIVNFERRKDIRPNDFTKTFCSLDVANLEIFHSQIKKNERPRVSKTINILDFFPHPAKRLVIWHMETMEKTFIKLRKHFITLGGKGLCVSLNLLIPLYLRNRHRRTAKSWMKL